MQNTYRTLPQGCIPFQINTYPAFITFIPFILVDYALKDFKNRDKRDERDKKTKIIFNISNCIHTVKDLIKSSKRIEEINGN